MRWRAFLVAGLISAAWGCSAEAQTKGCGDVGPEGGNPVLLEQRSDDAEGQFIRRVSPDGGYAEYSTKVTTLRDGELVTETVAPAWRNQERLRADQVRQIEGALREGFFDLPPEFTPPGEFADGYVVTWRACLDAREHAVALRSVDVAQIPALARVRDTFELALAQAAAEAGEHG